MTALEYVQYIIASNSIVKEQPKTKRFWLDIFYMMTIHMQGIKPRYRNLRLTPDAGLYYENDGIAIAQTQGFITPTGWDKKYQPIFDLRILNRYPTVREERYYWQCSIYPSFAQGLFLQSIDEIRGAIFQDSNYSISTTSEATNEYLYSKSFDGLDFFDYITNILLPSMIADPNGIIAVVPDMDNVSLSGEVVKYELDYISSERIIYKHGKTVAYYCKGKTIAVLDENNFIFVRYDAKTKKYIVSDVDIVNNASEMSPFKTFGGYYMHHPEFGGYYLSFFNGAIEWANAMIRQYLDCEGMNKDMIPITQIVEVDCSQCHATGKIPIPCDDGSYSGCTTTCPSCKGKAVISRNLGDVISVNQEQITDGKLPDYLRYITGNVDNLRYSDERFTDLYDKFLQALYLKFIETAQSGAAKEMDREKMYKFVQTVSDNLFDLITDLCVLLVAFIENKPADVSTAKIKRPASFGLKTEDELRDSLVKLNNANADPITIKSVSDALTVMEDDSPLTLKKIQVLSLFDPLRYKSDQSRAILSASGVVSKNDLIKNLRSVSELDRMIHEKTAAWFIDVEIDTILDELEKRVSPYYVNEQAPVPLFN